MDTHVCSDWARLRVTRVTVTLLACAIRTGAGIHPVLADPQQAPAPSPPPVTAPIESGALQNIAAERRAIDLAEVLRLAREQNLAIRRAGEAVTEQEAIRRGVRAQALPNLGLSAGIARLSPNIATVAGVPTGRATLAIAPGRVYYDTRAATFQVRASEFGQETVAQDVLLEATARYYNLELAQGLVRVAEQAVAQAQELVRRAQELQQAGLAITADVLRARATLSQQQQALVEAQKDFKLASISLATLLRIPPAVTLVAIEAQVAETTRVPPEEPLESLGERALRQRPELGRARAEIEAAVARRRSAFWGAVIPVFSVERWFGPVATDAPQSERRLWYYAEWRLLDNLGQSARSRIDQARSQERQAELRRSELRDQVSGEVIAAQQAVLAAREQIGVAQQEVAAAEASLRVFEERYRNGLGLQLDVLAGQEAVTRARQDLVRAVVRYNLAQAELATRIGEPLSSS
jgi:outer membrane protein TolC